MEKGIDSGLFVNDGSFMERFKQLQQEKEKGAPSDDSRPSTNSSGTLRPNPGISKSVFDSRENDLRKATSGASSGKLAFSLKQKSKLAVARIKLGEDEDEDEGNEGNVSDEGPTKRMRLGLSEASDPSLEQRVVAPLSPKDPAVKNVADKLASFVAKNGRQFEHVTRQRNPGDTPFKFLFDLGCEDYKYYEYRLTEEEKAIVQSQDSQASRSARTSTVSTTASRTSGGSQRLFHNHSDYQTPASALYDYNENTRASVTSAQAASVGRTSTYGESNAPSAADPVAMMEFYAKKAAQEERWKQPKQSKDEMPPPASLQGGSVKKGHHMGDYIPQEELEKFLSTCNDAAAQKAVREAAEQAKIQADNVGHRLLSKMGWKEGEGLGSSKSGRSDPVMAGNVKVNNLGVGASQPGEVTPEDDIYEQYKKRMMLGYRYRPNPLNNPRKAYY